MGIEVHTVEKYGCKIITVEPAERRIEGVIKSGSVVQVAVYSVTPLFRWPVVGEIWMIRRENGTWILDSLWENAEETVISDLESGDVLLNAPNGEIHLSNGAVLKPSSLGAFSFVFHQESPSMEWTIKHNLGCFPVPLVQDSAKDQIEGDVEYINDNEIKLIFSSPFSGTAYLN